MRTAPTAAGRTTPHRCQCAGGQWDREDVVTGGPPQVLNHLAVRGSAQRDDPWHVARIAPDEHDVPGLDGHIGSGTDGDTNIRGQEGGGIIDAVADHRDALATLLLFLDLGGLLVGSRTRES
jgi:hypothetical protein